MPKPKILSTDTISAISTPPGEGAIHIVRLSGRGALAIVKKVFRLGARKKKVTRLDARHMYYGYIVDGDTALDEVTLIYMKGPKTYTTEDMVEICVHGNYMLATAIVRVCIRAGARHAERGEFTKRAFVNGRIDLAQAEAVHELISAKTEFGVHVAFDHLRGNLSGVMQEMKNTLVDVLAEVEAYVDFPEDDVEIYSQKKIGKVINTVKKSLTSLLATYEHGEVVREGVKTVIVGRPNVGKSSLLNTLLNRDRALVSDIPGTTRDSLEELLDIQGILFRMVDTAGIRQGADPLESLSIQRAESYIAAAQLVLFVLDGARALSAEDAAILEKVKAHDIICVVNKSDLSQKLNRTKLEAWVPRTKIIEISTKNRTGIAALEKAIVSYVWHGAVKEDELMLTSERQYTVLTRVAESLEAVQEAFNRKASLEFLAFDLRETLDHLSEVVGEIYTDDILDVVFKKFCIGK